MEKWRPPTERQRARLIDELEEVGVLLDGSEPWHDEALTEIAYAVRPQVHERYVPSYGAIVEPTTDPGSWSAGTGLHFEHGALRRTSFDAARRYADGVASWLVRRREGPDEWVALDRPAGSERDLVVMAGALGAVIVQRHPTGRVRVVGPFGVLRWTGLGWRREPLVSDWIESVAPSSDGPTAGVLHRLVEFAVHDLGARGIGATIVHGADPERTAGLQLRLDTPPRLHITNPFALAPLRHALAQTDGAALFTLDGALEQLGVRLVPSVDAEAEVDGFGGMRHTSARRYSRDDPEATLVVVSEDGPVTVFRDGAVVGAAFPEDDPDPEPS